MALKEIRDTKIDKVKRLQAMGINPYPSSSNKSHSVEEALNSFDALSSEAREIVLAGRIMAQRGHGGAAFFDINDGGHKIQAHIKQDVIGDDGFNFFSDFCDVGDIVELTGPLIKTKKEEKTIEVRKIRMLSKAILPLPEKWHGLQDIDERFRKRYLDILLNPEVRDIVNKRAIFWNAVREFHINNGFIEVETPVLEVTTGGADATPFKTHHNALDIDVYLRISAGELWQKRLMVAGIPKTFEVGRIFRNEGMSPEHLQDYTQCEAYWSYANYEDMYKFLQECYRYVAQKTFGTLQFKINGFDIDLGKEWPLIDYTEEIKKTTGIDINTATQSEIESKLKELGVEYEAGNMARLIDSLWKYCRKKIGGPAILINEPKITSPLAKASEKNPKITERFHFIIAGSEVGQGYSELNDPIDQRERFEIQEKLRESGDSEAQMNDTEFVEALEHAMPPTAGHGFSERLFGFLMGKPLRETQIFPLMKPRTEKKDKELVSGVIVLNRGANLESWQELNTVAHLTAALGARQGRELLSRDTVQTKDGENIFLNIQHGLVIKQTNSAESLRDLITKAKESGFKISEFTREMLDTTNDKKIAEITKSKSMSEVEFLGVLIFGPKKSVEELTSDLERYK